MLILLPHRPEKYFLQRRRSVAGHQRYFGLERDETAFVDDADPLAQHLPRYKIRVVLQFGDDHFVTGVPRTGQRTREVECERRHVRPAGP